ncbi:hypothetical protein DETS111669_29640 [Delftia tsuruhatensis]
MPALLTDVGKVPRLSYPFLWADYVELLCLFNGNGIVSKGNIDSQKQEANDLQTPDNNQSGSTTESEEVDDKVSQNWSDIYSRLRARSAQYSDWPFSLERNLLRSKFDKGNAKHRLYAALLIASSLRLCLKDRANEVTSAFEEISFNWLRNALNDSWEVRPFGAHQSLPGSYDGNLLEKLRSLSSDIQATLVKPPEHYDTRNSGDAGIDLVAWLKMGDLRGNMPVIFGQCACSPQDWEDKQLDVTASATEAHILPQHPGAAYCFVPHDLHANEKLWERATHVKRTVLVDRIRIFKLLENSNAFSSLPAWTFVDDALEQSLQLAS